MFNKLSSLRIILANLGLINEAAELTKFADHQGSIVANLGYPKLLAKILQDKFGNNSFTMAKWLKEYYKTQGENDWINSLGKSGSWMHGTKGSVNRVLGLYDAATKALESGIPNLYVKYLRDNDFYVDKSDIDLDEREVSARKAIAKDSVEEELFNDIFFYNSFATDILSGKVTNLGPYEKLSFEEALEKYNKKKIFDDIRPIKVYPDGFKWIDAGAKCELLGKLMNNCGSSGVMSSDPDRTILALFDSNNKPHVMVTYSPNEKRISGEEGGGSSVVKDKYSSYVLDLADVLGAKFDTERSKTKILTVKGKLQGIATDIKRIKDFGGAGTYDELFSFKDLDGKEYYTDSYHVLSKEDADRACDYVAENLEFDDPKSSNGRIKGGNGWFAGSYPRDIASHPQDLIISLFNHHNRDLLTTVTGAEYIFINKFVQWRLGLKEG